MFEWEWGILVQAERDSGLKPDSIPVVIPNSLPSEGERRSGGKANTFCCPPEWRSAWSGMFSTGGFDRSGTAGKVKSNESCFYRDTQVIKGLVPLSPAPQILAEQPQLSLRKTTFRSTPLDEAKHYFAQLTCQRRFAPTAVRFSRNTVRLPPWNHRSSSPESAGRSAQALSAEFVGRNSYSDFVKELKVSRKPLLSVKHDQYSSPESGALRPNK
jgi:hypothetical protein